jgi:hypothetical protein
MLWLGKFLDMPSPVAKLSTEERQRGRCIASAVAAVWLLLLLVLALVDDDYDNAGSGTLPPGVPPIANIDDRCHVHQGRLASSECMPGLYKLVNGSNEPLTLPSGGPYHSGAQVVVFPFAMNYSTAECFCHSFHDGHLATIKSEEDYVAIKQATAQALQRDVKHPVILGAKKFLNQWVWASNHLVTPAELDFLFGGAKSPASDDPNNCAPVGTTTNGDSDTCLQGVTPIGCEYCSTEPMAGHENIFNANGEPLGSCRRSQSQSTVNQHSKCVLARGISTANAGPELGTTVSQVYVPSHKRPVIYLEGNPSQDDFLGYCNDNCVRNLHTGRVPTGNEGSLYAFPSSNHDFGFPACMFPRL